MALCKPETALTQETTEGVPEATGEWQKANQENGLQRPWYWRLLDMLNQVQMSEASSHKVIVPVYLNSISPCPCPDCQMTKLLGKTLPRTMELLVRAVPMHKTPHRSEARLTPRKLLQSKQKSSKWGCLLCTHLKSYPRQRAVPPKLQEIGRGNRYHQSGVGPLRRASGEGHAVDAQLVRIRTSGHHLY
jgi:hypothetical protein